MKKFLSILTVFILTAALFVSCDKKEVSPLAEDASDSTVNLYGSVIKINGDVGRSDTTFLAYARNTNIADMAIARFAEVENKYNCVLKQNKIVSESRDATSLMASGTLDVDIFIDDIFHGNSTYLSADFFYPINELTEYIDYTDSAKYGNSNNLEIFALDGNLYGVYPASWPEKTFMSIDFLLVFNHETVTGTLNLPDPREYNEQHVWTREQFEEAVKSYSYQNDNGVTVPGLGAFGRHFVDMSFRSFGVSIAMEQDGQMVNGYSTDAGIAAMTWAKNFMYGDMSSYIMLKPAADLIQPWLNGDVPMILQHSMYVFSNSASSGSSDISRCGIPFGILPFPSGDGNYVAQYERVINGTLISAISDDPENSAFILDKIYEPFPGLETRKDMAAYYTQNIFLDARDTEVVMSLTEHARNLFHDDGVNTINTALYNALKNKTAAEAIGVQEKAVQKVLDKCAVSAYETINSLYNTNK